MEFTRLYTTDKSNNIFSTEFKYVTSELKNPQGVTFFKSIEVEVPVNWSQLAADILVQKYFRKAGVPAITKKVYEEGIPEWLQRSEPDLPELAKLPKEKRYIGETSAKQVFLRLAGTWTYWGFKEGYFTSEADARIYFEEMQYILCHQLAAPNSPQWFNTGLYWSYGIDSYAEGHYYFDENLGRVIQSHSSYKRPQPHACFIQSIEDNLVNKNGIFDLFTKEARIFKYGSGSGTNFSNLRSKGEKLSGGGNSSGLMSFLKIADSAAGAIKSGGTTRRAAKMVVVDIDHPDIEEFITWKMREEQKVVALVTGSQITHKVVNTILKTCQEFKGERKDSTNPLVNTKLHKALNLAGSLLVPQKYLTTILTLAEQGIYEIDFPTFIASIDSESYATVSGQNANNTVSISNAFLEKVQKNELWDLINRNDGQVSKTVDAKHLWNQIAYSAWSCADPGLHFSTTINSWHTCPEDGRINASNPCSEYLFLDNTACNLASINVMKFRSPNGTLQVAKFKEVVKLITFTLEVSIAMAQFPSSEIADLSYRFRTLGLGYANVGAYLTSIGLPYDSDEGRNTVAAITALLTGASYTISAEIAKEKGAFLGFEKNKAHMLRVIANHRRAAYGFKDSYDSLPIDPVPFNKSACKDSNLALEVVKTWDNALLLGEHYGYRNAQVTAIAPTGTIALLMDCDTTGIEPDFALVKYKSLAGGGYFKIINQSIILALEHLKYSSENIKAITNYAVGYKTFVGAPHINHDTLKDKGFTEDKLQALEKTIPSIFNIEFAFHAHILGEEFCTNVLKIDLEKLKNPNFSILQAIGFTPEEILEANKYVVGAMTIEGAPHLKEEHLPIFDCANLCGDFGTRALSYISHIKMLAAAQSFVSGGISKTINMPTTSTIQDCANAYLLSWKLGIKANALYRDGSKIAQPLQSTLFNGILDSEDIISKVMSDDTDIFTKPTHFSSSENILKLAEISANKFLHNNQTKHYKSLRERPHNKRFGYNQKAKISNQKVYIHTGEYEDGRLSEIFLDVYKEGVAFKSMLNCFAIAISIGLQYGVPLEEFVDAFVFTKFEPSGLVTGHERIKMASSIVDYIFRDLAINYLGRDDLAHVEARQSTKKTSKNTSVMSLHNHYEQLTDENVTDSKINDNNETNHSLSSKTTKITTNNSSHTMNGNNLHANGKATHDTISNINLKNGYEGEACPECQNMTLIRNGVCLLCTTCGSTTGCS